MKWLDSYLQGSCTSVTSDTYNVNVCSFSIFLAIVTKFNIPFFFILAIASNSIIDFGCMAKKKKKQEQSQGKNKNISYSNQYLPEGNFMLHPKISIRVINVKFPLQPQQKYYITQ